MPYFLLRLLFETIDSFLESMRSESCNTIFRLSWLPRDSSPLNMFDCSYVLLYVLHIDMRNSLSQFHFLNHTANCIPSWKKKTGRKINFVSLAIKMFECCDFSSRFECFLTARIQKTKDKIGQKISTTKSKKEGKKPIFKVLRTLFIIMNDVLSIVSFSFHLFDEFGGFAFH